MTPQEQHREPAKNRIDQPGAPQIQTVPTTTTPPRRLPGWRLWVPLAIQSVLIVAVPAQDAVTYATGTPVTLQTAPVDPYDFMRGYYQTLSYDISQPETLQALPGGAAIFSTEGYWKPRSFYVVLEAPATTVTPPDPWQPIRISHERPKDLAPQQIALKGEYTGIGVITYGLERYYMPADRRQDVNADINQTQWQDRESFVVDIRVDDRGNAVPAGLWVRERNYRF
ncbi:MAG: GDYXXLXY domain-containing protein [Cyanobacteria bacterium J06632_22]